MTDIAIIQGDEGFEIGKDSAKDLVVDEGLETAIIISLFTDQRVSEAELPPGVTFRGGWWGDQFLENPSDKLGSKLWTFARDKITGETASAIRVRAKQALEWLTDDGVASKLDVATEIVSIDGYSMVKISINITRPGEKENDVYALFWDGQTLKR